MDNTSEFRKIEALIPLSSKNINWEAFENTLLQPIFALMAKTQQNPLYHGEKDVFSHTKMVCEELIKLPEYIASSEKDKKILFLSALLHDMGKIRCTVFEDEVIKSPHHASSGAIAAREFLWKKLSLCGSFENQQLREAICNLIRYHSFPPYAIKNERPELRLLQIASTGELSRDFSIEKLYILEKADAMGRICEDREEMLENIECCKLLSTEEDCFTAPFHFPDSFSKRAFFKQKTLWKNQTLYNDSWGEIILMSGLPGTGKDTVIKEYYSHLPMISLDEIRKEYKISPTGNQQKVVAIAHERARELLRKKQAFVWNATNITEKIRASQISLFEEYGASVKTLFLETGFDEELLRNESRENAVPLRVIENMLSVLTLPQSYECEKVEWRLI